MPTLHTRHTTSLNSYPAHHRRLFVGKKATVCIQLGSELLLEAMGLSRLHEDQQGLRGDGGLERTTSAP